MTENVLLGVPAACPSHVVESLESCLREFLSDVGEFVVVYNELDYVQELVGKKGKYSVTVAVDTLGEGSTYVPYLQGALRKNPTLREVVIIPNDRKGTVHVEELLELGLFNALYQRDLNKDTLCQLVTSPRQPLDAAKYYDVDVDALVKKNALIVYGSDNKSRSGAVTRPTRYEGVTVTRGTASDFGHGGKGDTFNDDEMLSFFEETGWGMDHVGTVPTKLMEFPLDEEWVESYKQVISKYYRDKGLADLQAFERGAVTEQEFRNIVSRKMNEYKIPADRQRKVIDAFLRDLISYGKIDVIINTEDVSDIKLNSKDSVTVQYKGEWYNTNIKFQTDEEFSYFVTKVCTKNHVAVNINNTQTVFSDITTFDRYRLRITVSHKSINTNGLTTASIRKIDKVKKLAADLIKEGYWTASQAGFLINAVRSGKSMLISGGSGSGKTVGLNCLLEYMADNITGICIQEAEELHAEKKVNLEFQHSVAAKGEGKAGVSLKELATQGLLKNAKVFIIGEIKGKEAEDFMTAANTGAQSIATTHSNTIFDSPERIADLARGAGYTQDQMLRMIARSVDLLVGMNHYHVETIASIVGWDEEKGEVIYDVYNFA